MNMKQVLDCGCGLVTCNVTGTIQVSVTVDGKPAILLAARDNSTRELVSVVLDARAVDAINNMWDVSVARRKAYADAISEPHI